MSLIDTIRCYDPYNEQEERDRLLMLSLLQSERELFTRDNECAHFTASA